MLSIVNSEFQSIVDSLEGSEQAQLPIMATPAVAFAAACAGLAKAAGVVVGAGAVGAAAYGAYRAVVR